MKRVHISLATADIEKSKAFYSTMFGADPTMDRGDYVQWMLDDPMVNFVIETGGKPGVTHMGIQAENEAELADQFDRVEKAGGAIWNQGETTCCYARSTKSWTRDPDGINWETFHTHERTGEYGTHVDVARAEEAASTATCCG